MSAWSHLPNARHIDWVIQSVKTHPEVWAATWSAIYDATLDAAYDATLDVALNAALDVTLDSALDSALDAAYEATRGATYDASRDTAHEAARDAILALVAYDDCDQYLEMTSEELKVWARLSESPAAVLLVPMVVVRERIKDLEHLAD